MEFQEQSIEEVSRILYKYCLQITGSYWTAEDLVQETLIKVIKMKRDEPQRQISLPFLYTIAKNRYVDELRKEQKYSAMSGDLYIEHQDFREWDELLQILCSSLPLKNIKTNKSSIEPSVEKDFKNAIKNNNPFEIFHLYRLIESENYSLYYNKAPKRKTLFISDPDGNMLELSCII